MITNTWSSRGTPVGTGPWTAPAVPAVTSATADAMAILLIVHCIADDASAANIFFIAVSLFDDWRSARLFHPLRVTVTLFGCEGTVSRQNCMSARQLRGAEEGSGKKGGRQTINCNTSWRQNESRLIKLQQSPARC